MLVEGEQRNRNDKERNEQRREDWGESGVAGQ